MIFPGYTRPPIDDLFAPKRRKRGGLRLTISLTRTPPAPEAVPFVPQPIPVSRRGFFRRKG